MSYKIDEIEGIGPAYAAKLQAAGLNTTEKLLAACATPKGRASTAESTGLSPKNILTWTNMADLMRLKNGKITYMPTSFEDVFKTMNCIEKAYLS